jgi:hypothetical protein
MNKKTSAADTCTEQTVYELEGEPNEVFDAQGNPVTLTPEQQQELENE